MNIATVPPASPPSGSTPGLRAAAGVRDPSRPSRGLWPETGLLVLAGSLLLLAMVQPAFGTFFLGEDFSYLGLYRAHGNDYWAAVLSPLDTIYFRPVLSAINLLGHAVLPLDPWFHHVRNFLSSALDLLLLHRVLVRLVASPAARALALLFFALSKVHLTTIGFTTNHDSILILMLLLATLLCFLRYLAHRRRLDYALGLLFCFLSVFSKDYGLVAVAVVLALVACRGIKPGEARTQFRRWALLLAPLPAMVVVYLGLRFAIVGPLPSSNPVYTPRLSLDLSARKLLAFTSTMANLSLTNNGDTGASALGTWLSTTLPGSGPKISWGDAALYVGFLALLFVTLAIGRRAGRALLVPLVWIAAYLGPTLLVRNVNMYYMYEPLAGAGVLLGMCLDRAGRRFLGVWALALAVIGVNGTLSNYTSLYHWQFAASAAQKIRQPVLEAHRGEPIESITFITGSQPFWQWVLTADTKGPMIPELMKLPGLRIGFIDYTELPGRAAAADQLHLLFDVDNGFLPYDLNRRPPAPVLRELSPARTRPGTGFNVQPDGQSALTLAAEHATPGTTVIFDETRLATAYGSPTYVTALVPAELLARPGRHSVYLDNGVSESNRVEFAVGREEPAPPAAAPPAMPAPGPLLARQVAPSQTRAGRGFNVQADGRSALSVDCENAPPGTLVVFDGTPLETAYGSDRLLTAAVPAELYSRPGRHAVYLQHGASESNRLEFAVEGGR